MVRGSKSRIRKAVPVGDRNGLGEHLDDRVVPDTFQGVESSSNRWFTHISLASANTRSVIQHVKFDWLPRQIVR